MPLDQPYVSILRDDYCDSIAYFPTETVGSAVPGADLFDEFPTCVQPLDIESVRNCFGIIQVS